MPIHYSRCHCISKVACRRHADYSWLDQALPALHRPQTGRSEAVVPRITGAALFAEMMEGYGVTHIFFVPAFMLKAFAEMEDRPIRRIMVHGEKAAAYMADGYARASGKPGVCMAQMIGASNLAAGLRDGFMAGSPMIAITGGPTPQSRYRHAYQEG